jgi:cytochrome c-type biogenesis protein CcmH
MGTRLAALAICVLLFGPAPARAVEADEILADRKLEGRARAISAELRCLVCQNQSIDDSNAPLARDLRLLVRERLKAGDNDDQVKRFVVDRYGKFVLLKPPFDPQTALLWLTPFLVLATAGLVIVGRLRQGRPWVSAPGGPLTPDEERRLRALLETEKEKGLQSDRST